MEAGSTQDLTPVIVVIVVVVVTFLFIVGCLGFCIKVWSSRRVYSAGPGPQMARQQRGERTPSVGARQQPGERTPSVGLQLPGQPPSYQSGPALLPPTYDAVMGNSCQYPTVAHGGEVPNGAPPPPTVAHGGEVPNSTPPPPTVAHGGEVPNGTPPPPSVDMTVL